MTSRRIVSVAVLAAAALSCATPRAGMPVAGDARLVVVGDVVLPAMNARGKPRVDVGGLSGAFYDADRNRLYAVADDRQRPRVLGFDVTLEPGVSLVARELVALQPPPGNGRTLDAEGIAPGRQQGWFVSSEGDPVRGTQPLAGIHEYTRAGVFVRSLHLPAAYHSGGNSSSGMRLNLSLEALSASPDRRWLFAGMESSLLQDGPAANFERGALVRLLAYDLRNLGAPPREYAYLTDAMPRPAAWTPTDGDAGVVDVLALSATDLLVLERGYVVEDPTPTSRRENTIRIYRVRLSRAAEITGRESLVKTPPAAVLNKALMLDLASVATAFTERLRRLENFEAITFGPRLADGSTTVLLLSDDNFSPSQVTALVALRWTR
jgi:glycerophosphoryl diester phosphodiesterase